MIEIFNCGLETAVLFFCIIICLLYHMRNYHNGAGRAFLMALLMEIILLVCDIVESCTVIFHFPADLTGIALTFDYVFAYLFAFLFHRYVIKKIEELSKHHFSLLTYNFGILMIIVVFAMLNLNMINGSLFTVDSQNYVEYHNLILIPNALYLVIAIVDVIMVYRYREFFNRRTFVLFIMYAVFFVCTFPLDMMWGTSLTYVAVGMILTINILNIALEEEYELSETKLNTMHLQMRPHFIYNTLASISGLCYIDPEKAAEYIGIFSKYLRMSFGDMTSKSTITFKEEIEHLQLYMSIEQLRFADIEIITDFQATDFILPCLTVQPLVENAIKHGLCAREEGGILKVSSYETDREYVIEVKDNGVGFTDIPKDGRKHIGMENVGRRLKIQDLGWLEIESEIGEGTTAKVHIRK